MYCFDNKKHKKPHIHAKFANTISLYPSLMVMF